MLIITVPMLIYFVCLCKYGMRHHTYKTLVCASAKAFWEKWYLMLLSMQVCAFGAHSELWSQHLYRQNNSAQPRTRPITSALLLWLQINLNGFILFPPSSSCLFQSPRLQRRKTTDPCDSTRAHWRTGGLGRAPHVSLHRQHGSLILLSPFSDWLALSSEYYEEIQNICQNKYEI